MNRRFLALLVLVATALLAACGGGDDEERLTAAPLRAFADGSGIGRRDTLLFYAPDLAGLVQAVNEGDGSDNGVRLPDDSNMPVVAQYTYAELRRGVATFENQAVNIAVLSDKRTDDLGAAFIELPGAPDIIIIGGEPATDVATAGTHRYTGTQSASERSTLAPGQIGTFTLDVNHSSRTFVFTSQTATFSAAASGSFDAATGLFASANVTITADGRTYVGHLYGQLHGAGASGTTGIIVTDDFQADYSGAFIGVR